MEKVHFQKFSLVLSILQFSDPKAVDDNFEKVDLFNFWHCWLWAGIFEWRTYGFFNIFISIVKIFWSKLLVLVFFVWENFQTYNMKKFF